MCGIMAVIPAPGHPIDIAAFNALMESSRKRGRHASGYCVYNDPTNFALVKEPGPFLKIDPHNELIANARCIIGHVRQASKGHFTDNWANHPHRVDNLIMVHNGTAPTILERADELGLDNPTHNDSYAMLQLIKRGVDAGQPLASAIAKVLAIFIARDTAAIILLDTDTGDLFIARSNGTTNRPIIVSPQEHQVIIASEEEFIESSYPTAQRKFGWKIDHNVIFEQGTVVKANVFDISSPQGCFQNMEKIPTYCNEEWISKWANQKQQKTNKAPNNTVVDKRAPREKNVSNR